MVPEIMNAIISISNGTAQASVIDNNIDKISWENGATPIPKADIEAKLIEMRASYQAQEYARSRAKAYDSVGNQLDQIMKDMRDGTTTHQTACEAVKAKFPK